MKMRKRLFVLCVAAALCAGAAAWVGAQGSDDDDRPPIIVQSGSIKFFGGDPDDVGNPKKCCRNWKRDLFGEQWKPDESASDAVRFEVTAKAGGCPAQAASGEVVEVDYTAAGRTSTFRFYLQPYFLFGTVEPKLDSPVQLHNTKQGRAPAPRRGSVAPGVLDYGAPGQGAISRVKVGTASPCTPAGNAVISIQPKKH